MTQRPVRLFEGTSPYAEVAATVIRDAPVTFLDRLEREWDQQRKDLAALFGAASLILENSHWDWRNKWDRVNRGVLRLVVAERAGDIEGVMAVAAQPRYAVATPGSHVIYVDYLEVAPWNVAAPGRMPRLRAVGSALMTEAIRLSRDDGHDGRVGLHSLPQAVRFYRKLGMTDVGSDPAYYNLDYFEFATHQADQLVPI